MGSNASYSIDFVYEYDAWCLLARHLEDIANELSALTYELVH